MTEKFSDSMWFFIPNVKAEAEKANPVPERCSHKCIDCGMYYQHRTSEECTKAKHTGCNAKAGQVR